MTAAIFALMGTIIGVLGTLTVELTRNRAADKRSHREALRIACADFTAAIARTINLAAELQDPDPTDIKRMHDADVEVRAGYERLRLISGSQDVQEAGRHVVRYAIGLLRQAEGRPPRSDELERRPRLLLQDWLIRLYVAVRKEIGVPHPQEVYREPDDWLEPTVRWRLPKKETE